MRTQRPHKTVWKIKYVMLFLCSRCPCVVGVVRVLSLCSRCRTGRHRLHRDSNVLPVSLVDERNVLPVSSVVDNVVCSSISFLLEHSGTVQLITMSMLFLQVKYVMLFLQDCAAISYDTGSHIGTGFNSENRCLARDRLFFALSP